MLKDLFTKYKYLAIVVLISIVAVFDLSHYGIPPTHDAEYHVLRFQQFYKVISEGVFYPRWAPDFNNGFGVPLFNYVYPLPNYLASLFHSLGFGFIESFKLIMATSTIFGAIFFYLWSRKYWGDWGGVVSSVFYTFAPYHFVDIYVRGSVGEVVSLGLFPALLWSYLSFIDGKKVKYLVLSSVFLALLILAHNILALIFAMFFATYAIMLLSKKNRSESIRALVVIFITGFGLAAPFWLPALLETKFVQGLQIYNIGESFPAIYKLFVPTWGFGISPNDPLNPMSVQVGIANWIIIFFAFIALFFRKDRKFVVFSLVWLLVLIFFLTPYSLWFWEHLPLIKYFQFSWRLLSLVILLSAFLAGSLVSDKLIKNKSHIIWISAALIILVVALGLRNAKVPFYHEREDSHYFTRSNFTDGTNSPGNAFNTKWLSKIPEKRSEKVKIIEDKGRILILEKKSNLNTIYAMLENPSRLSFSIAYFPGWEASIDGKKANIVNNKGIVAVNVPKGKHLVNVSLGYTSAQAISYIYFIVSVVLLALICTKSLAIIKK